MNALNVLNAHRPCVNAPYIRNEKITQSAKYEKRNFWRVQIKKHIKVDQIFADRNFRQTMGRERERERTRPLMKY